jgi:Cytochrome b5-like Heme/Steroid binding domain
MSIPAPSSLITGEQAELPVVEQLGTISLETLHLYHCDNPDRRLLSLFGTVYDVTSSEKSYGADGAYKEYAGHDITLALSMSKTDEKWLDRFVEMKEKWTKSARDWQAFFDQKYPVAGRLDVWDDNPGSWPALAEEETTELEKGCLIM